MWKDFKFNMLVSIFIVLILHLIFNYSIKISSTTIGIILASNLIITYLKYRKFKKTANKENKKRQQIEELYKYWKINDK